MEIAAIRERTMNDTFAVQDTEDFRRVVETYKKRIFHLAYDLTRSIPDAEDLSQEVFIKAFRSFGRFRMDAGPYTWLYRITVNTFIDQKRKLSDRFERYREEFQEERFQASTSGRNDPESSLEAEQIGNHISRALECLTENERAAFVLKHREHLRIDEIAEIMGIAAGTVKSYLFRSMVKMKNALKGHFLAAETKKETDDERL